MKQIPFEEIQRVFHIDSSRIAMMPGNQPPAKPSDSKQDPAKTDLPIAQPKQRDDVDAKTAAENRSTFFKNS